VNFYKSSPNDSLPSLFALSASSPLLLVKISTVKGALQA
jgi:hypothetical protein